MAVATAITGGFVALPSPATADTGVEVRNVAAHQVTDGIKQAPVGLVSTTREKPVGGGGDGGGDSKHTPPPAPSLPPPTTAIDSAITVPLNQPGAATAQFTYVGVVQGNGTVLIRDSNPTLTTRWFNISTLTGFPPNVVDVALAGDPDIVDSTATVAATLVVAVRSSTGQVMQTTCVTNFANSNWGSVAATGPCTAFTNITPPNG